MAASTGNYYGEEAPNPTTGQRGGRGGWINYKYVRRNKSNNVIRNGQNTFYEGIKLPTGKGKGKGKVNPITGHEGPELE